MEQQHTKKEQTRILLMTMKASLLEKLDHYRWPNEMTRSNAIAEALEFYLDHHNTSSTVMEAGGRTS